MITDRESTSKEKTAKNLKFSAVFCDLRPLRLSVYKTNPPYFVIRAMLASVGKQKAKWSE